MKEEILAVGQQQLLNAVAGNIIVYSKKKF